MRLPDGRNVATRQAVHGSAPCARTEVLALFAVGDVYVSRPVPKLGCASSKLLRPRNQGLTLRLNSGPKTAKLRRYAQRCCLPRLTWRPCHSGDVSAPRRPGVGERRFAAASDGAEEERMCPEVRGKRTAPSTPSSGYQIRRQPPRVREPRSDLGSRRCAVVESGQRR